MRRALIGHTGFVGANILRQAAFDELFNSSNIESIRGRSLELVVCAGAPGVKWKANREPERDREGLERLMACLGAAEIGHLVLVSTVDVYPEPVGVDEDTPIDPDAGHPYGRHRLRLERFAEERFATTVLRLPGLFGPGLRKNLVHDLLHDHRVDQLDSRDRLQFYDLAWLWADVERIRARGLRLVNLATEPLAAGEIAERVFGRTLGTVPGRPPVRYDFRSRHAEALGGGAGYLYAAEPVLGALEAFVAGEGARG